MVRRVIQSLSSIASQMGKRGERPERGKQRSVVTQATIVTCNVSLLRRGWPKQMKKKIALIDPISVFDDQLPLPSVARQVANNRNSGSSLHGK